MTERFRSPEQKEHTRRPKLLDIVKIDGRWAQVRPTETVVRFLGDFSREEINWDDYQMVKDFKGSSVANILQFSGEEFSEKEIENIHWGSEEEREHPGLKVHLKKLVSVFGEYEKKR